MEIPGGVLLSGFAAMLCRQVVPLYSWLVNGPTGSIGAPSFRQLKRPQSFLFRYLSFVKDGAERSAAEVQRFSCAMNLLSPLYYYDLNRKDIKPR